MNLWKCANWIRKYNQSIRNSHSIKHYLPGLGTIAYLARNLPLLGLGTIAYLARNLSLPGLVIITYLAKGPSGIVPTLLFIAFSKTTYLAQGCGNFFQFCQWYVPVPVPIKNLEGLSKILEMFDKIINVAIWQEGKLKKNNF